MGLSLIVCDTETSHLDPNVGHVLEVAFLDVKSGDSKNWFLKPMDSNGIDPKALEVNGAKLEDLLWQTQAGRDKYKDPMETLPEIEDWILDHTCGNIYQRVIIGHNPNFDFLFLKSLWARCNADDTFPFSKFAQLIDTKQMVLLYDYMYPGADNQKYNLAACVKKFGISKKFDYHGALSDTFACKLLFDELCKKFKAQEGK